MIASRGGRIATAVSIALVAAALHLAVKASAKTAAAEIGRAAPVFTARAITHADSIITFSAYRGHVVVLNAWATWCGECRQEMPELQAVAVKERARGLRVVAVSVDVAESSTLVRRFVTDFALTFDVLHDPTGAFVSDYQIQGVPQFFFVDRDGLIRGRFFGDQWRSASAQRLLEELLASPRPDGDH